MLTHCYVSTQARVRNSSFRHQSGTRAGVRIELLAAARVGISGRRELFPVGRALSVPRWRLIWALVTRVFLIALVRNSMETARARGKTMRRIAATNVAQQGVNHRPGQIGHRQMGKGKMFSERVRSAEAKEAFVGFPREATAISRTQPRPVAAEMSCRCQYGRRRGPRYER